MNKTSAFRKDKKTAVKVVVGSTLGLALLLGGSTFALWSATDTSSTGSTITTGDLKVTAASVQKWFDITDTAAPTQITDLSAYRLSPGRTLQLKQDLNAVVIGDNISGVLTVNVPNDTLSAPLMSQAVFTLTLLDKDGKTLGTVTPAVNTANSLVVNAGNLPQTTTAGDLYTVELTVALPSTADDTTKTQTVSLSDMSITLNQGPKYVVPIAAPQLVATSSLPGVTEGSSYSQSIAGPGGAATYDVTAGALPEGLTLDESTGLISGTATHGGSATFTVTATNVSGSVSQAYTINTAYVAPGVPNSYYVNFPTVVYSFGQAFPGSAYDPHQMKATGNDITWSITAGALPTGITLDPTTGLISGTGSGATADYNFTVTATNPAGSNSQSFMIRLDPDLPEI